jgi:hypothetical protein
MQNIDYKRRGAIQLGTSIRLYSVIAHVLSMPRSLQIEDEFATLHTPSKWKHSRRALSVRRQLSGCIDLGTRAGRDNLMQPIQNP